MTSWKDEQQKEKLSRNGIQLLNYIPSKSFYAKVNLDRLEEIKGLENLLSISPITVDYKLTPELKAGFYPDHAVFGNEVQIEVTCFDGFQEIIRQDVLVMTRCLFKFLLQIFQCFMNFQNVISLDL